MEKAGEAGPVEDVKETVYLLSKWTSNLWVVLSLLPLKGGVRLFILEQGEACSTS